jgi:hypothetical protein
MKKSVVITLVVVVSSLVLAETAVGLWLGLTPTSDSELSVESLTTDANDDTISLTLTCDGNQSGQTHRHRRHFAYMRQIQFKNGTSGETLYQEQYQWRWRHRIRSGNNYYYQYQFEGLEVGQTLQLRIQYNNGKVLEHSFTVNN